MSTFDKLKDMLIAHYLNPFVKTEHMQKASITNTQIELALKFICSEIDSLKDEQQKR
jgi:hypothetical protein